MPVTRLAWFWIPFVVGCASTLSAAPEVSPPQPSAALTAAHFWPASQPSAQPAPHTIALPRAVRRPDSETASDAPAVTERLTFISVVQGQQRVVYLRRRDVLPRSPSDRAPTFQFSEGGGRTLSLTVLTPEGLCHARSGRSVTASLNCGRRSGEWSGFEIDGCAFPEAGPLVVFQGHEPLRVQSLVGLPEATGGGARAFKRRVAGQAPSAFEETTDSLFEAAEMQREMEAMPRAQAGLPPLPPPPPVPPARLGTVRRAFDVWMVEALGGRGVPLMVTRTPDTNLRFHRGSQWHTLVAGPRDADYAYLIGTRAYSWPVVVPVRQGTWPPSRRALGPPFGWFGPAMCADL